VGRGVVGYVIGFVFKGEDGASEFREKFFPSMAANNAEKHIQASYKDTLLRVCYVFKYNRETGKITGEPLL